MACFSLPQSYVAMATEMRHRGRVAMGNRGWYLIKTIIGYSLDRVCMPWCLCEPQNRVLISLSLILVSVLG